MAKTKLKILNVKIDNVTLNQAQKKLADLMEQKKPSIICTPNTEMLVLAQKDEGFRDILNKESNLNLPDGFGLLWAARFNHLSAPNIPILRPVVIFTQWLCSIILIPLLPALFKDPIKERVSGSDFIYKIADFAAENKVKIFLLGGAPTVAERTALQLQTKIPNLKIAGVHSGDISETADMIETINKSKAEILLVAFGAPKQENWLDQNLSKTCCKIGIGLGGSFDFVARVRRRAPSWMQKSGLEWLYRLTKEPKRITRQLALPKFLWLILLKRLSADQN